MWNALNKNDKGINMDSVMQLQTMNEMMKDQFHTYPVSSVMIFGIAGGNGLEHIQKDKFEKVYGVDINSSYLQEVIFRYPDLSGLLKCLCINLINETPTGFISFIRFLWKFCRG